MASSSDDARRLQNIDLAFVMDCTASMGSYIEHAKKNINKIADEIIRAEKCRLRIALVEYRDHPPQDHTFITRVNLFTNDIAEAKKFIANATPGGGGDFPESVCCGLYDAANNLNWDVDSVKITVLIADAPPHGLHGVVCDGMPNGCPKKNDPVELAYEMAEKSITLYVAGCEPSLTPYRDFFTAISLITGGKYVPLDRAENLSDVIVGGTREEVSLERLMAKVHEEVLKEAADKGQAVNEDELTKRIHQVLNSHGATANTMKIDNINDVEITDRIKEMSKLKTLNEMNTYLKGSKNTTTTTSAVAERVKKVAKTRGRAKKAKTPSPPPSPPPKAAAVLTRAAAKSDATVKKKEDKKPVLTAAATSGKAPARKGIRRSTRLAFNSKEDALKYIEETGGDTDIEDEEEEEKEIPKKKPKLTKVPSSVSVSTDDKIDIEQARRLVKKSLARNKLRK